MKCFLLGEEKNVWYDYHKVFTNKLIYQIQQGCFDFCVLNLESFSKGALGVLLSLKKSYIFINIHLYITNDEIDKLKNSYLNGVYVSIVPSFKNVIDKNNDVVFIYNRDPDKIEYLQSEEVTKICNNIHYV